jgi:sugar lactone lactonase YvrE
MESCFHVYDPAWNKDTRYHIGQYVGAVVPDNDNGFILAARDGFFHFDPDTQTLEPICNPEEGIQATRFNDGKCDARGRFWAGTMEYIETTI